MLSLVWKVLEPSEAFKANWKSGCWDMRATTVTGTGAAVASIVEVKWPAG